MGMPRTRPILSPAPRSMPKPLNVQYNVIAARRAQRALADRLQAATVRQFLATVSPALVYDSSDGVAHPDARKAQRSAWSRRPQARTFRAMTFRAKFLTLFSLAVLAVTGVLAWGAAGLAREEFERFASERNAALSAQFQLELARRAEEVSFAMQGLADAEGTLRMALDLSRAQADASVYANDARGLATSRQLDFLDVVAGDGTLITSARWTARSGYKNDWV